MVKRRKFLQDTSSSLMTILTGSMLSSCHSNKQEVITSRSLLDQIGPLLPPDNNGVMLPPGFTSRIVASSGTAPHIDSPYIWHDAPDGGAIFSTDEGGWIYVSNSEIGNNMGGVGAIRFDPQGNIINAYSILGGSNRNCAGGATSWGSWLSCEEVDNGIIWECDPLGETEAVRRSALGTFAHEAIALDTDSNYLYMTEDKPDGGFYRFVPISINSSGIPNLSEGTVEVAVVAPETQTISWTPLIDPGALNSPTRYQISASTIFNGGEGIIFYDGAISFATKGDNRIWSYDTISNILSVIYEADTHPTPILTGVDNINISLDGELIVGEDGGDLQIVALTKNNKLIPLVQLVGHEGSEITGPAFSPGGTHLYFSSQRGKVNSSSNGMTFEITGPFHL